MRAEIGSRVGRVPIPGRVDVGACRAQNVGWHARLECLARVWELGTCQNNVNLDVTEYGVRMNPCERGVPMAWHLEAGHPVPVPEIVTSTGPNRKRAARHRRQKTYSTAQLGSIFARLP